ncbi:MAG: SpoIIE family protein phosphatase [Candidatus Woesearchaeota archaeon]|nr:SpoIIE family protein phosphatase [Candidatus Woesearchaeota archaeon]
MDADALDKKVQEFVTEARTGSIEARLSLRKELDALFDLPHDALHEQQRNEVLDYVIRQLIEEKLPEKLASMSFNDSNIAYEARTVPAIRSDGSSFYLSGDMHFFYALDSRNYVLGRMDGSGHGVKAAVIVFAACKYIEECIQQRILLPGDFAYYINERLVRLVPRGNFSTLFMSVLDDKRIQFTDIGDGRTFLYEPGKASLTRIFGKGPVLGAITPEQMQKLNVKYKTEERNLSSGDLVVSFSDGVYERIGYDASKVDDIIVSGQSISSIVTGIMKYALGMPHQETDDVTVIGLTVK